MPLANRYRLGSVLWPKPHFYNIHIDIGEATPFFLWDEKPYRRNQGK